MVRRWKKEIKEFSKVDLTDWGRSSSNELSGDEKEALRGKNIYNPVLCHLWINEYIMQFLCHCALQVFGQILPGKQQWKIPTFGMLQCIQMVHTCNRAKSMQEHIASHCSALKLCRKSTENATKFDLYDNDDDNHHRQLWLVFQMGV